MHVHTRLYYGIVQREESSHGFDVDLQPFTFTAQNFGAFCALSLRPRAPQCFGFTCALWEKLTGAFAFQPSDEQ